jgi:flagellar assembly factor FliW
VQINTSRFGTLDVDKEELITFSEGLLGFPDLKEFIIIEHPGGPFQWIQSADDANVAFPTLDPAWAKNEYSARLEDADLKMLNLGPEGGDIILLAIVNVTEPSNPTINLLAPICISVETRHGVQVVQHNSGMSTRQPLVTTTSAERRVA